MESARSHTLAEVRLHNGGSSSLRGKTGPEQNDAQQCPNVFRVDICKGMNVKEFLMNSPVTDLNHEIRIP